VTYATDLKTTLLGVPAGIIEREGSVSEATARAMADGAAEQLGAEVAVSVTGSAGPDPLEHPPGTMIIGVHTPADTRARTMRLPGDRERVRTYASTAALHLLRLGITGTWW
jgi:nicotinamide-nucleotide amidase